MIPSRLELIIHHDSITRAISTHFRLDKLPTSHEGPILTQRNCSLRKSLGRLHGWQNVPIHGTTKFLAIRLP